MRTPAKPFPSYKWRWATTTPTEGLDEPSVYLGVLKAMRACEGLRPTDAKFIDLLQRVQDDTGATVNLARTQDRNLLRNSSQYWKALGLLRDTQPIELTRFGREVTDGFLAVGDFAAAVVRTLVLPNTHIETNDVLNEWSQAGLELRPLDLIMSIVRALDSELGPDEAYLETQELTRIVIPLAGDGGKLGEYVDAIRSHRRYDSLPNWPDCCPASNDMRMAREFLLFLWHYGYLRRVPGPDRERERYHQAEENVVEVEALMDLQLGEGSSFEAAAKAVRRAGVIAIPAERRKVERVVSERPGQGRFRSSVLAAYGGRCALTGESVRAALDACHIRPANDEGPDDPANGICLRIDLHRLYDRGYLRIHADGTVVLADELESSPTYASLPRRVDLVFEESAEYLSWRENYVG